MGRWFFRPQMVEKSFPFRRSMSVHHCLMLHLRSIPMIEDQSLLKAGCFFFGGVAGRS